MRSTPYKQLISRLASYLQVADGISVEDATLSEPKINLFVRLAWEHYWWPDLMLVEKRTLRPAWAFGAYTAGTEVYYTTGECGEYYQALVTTSLTWAVNNGLEDGINGSYVWNATTSRYELASGRYIAYSGTRWELFYASTATFYLDGATWMAIPGDRANFGNTYTVPLPPLTNGVLNSSQWALCQQSYSADVWAEGDVFVVGDQTINPADGEFYQCITAHTAGTTFDATKFGLLTPFVRSLAYEQTDETALGEIRFLWDRDPEIYREAQTIPFRLRADYVQVLGTSNVFWVEFRQRPSTYTNTVIVSTATYTSGSQIYDPATGENWISTATATAGQTPTTNPEKWSKVPFPYYFLEYVAVSVSAALTNKENSSAAQQPENFTVPLSAGAPFLMAEIDKIERQQGQTRQLNVKSGRARTAGWNYRR